MHIDRTVTAMDLADFLAEKLKSSSYRLLEDELKISRGSLENIIKRQNTEFPKIETLIRIAAYYNKEPWEVMQMADVNLGLPKTPTERAQRLEQLIARQPALDHLIEGLEEKIDTNPGFVDAMIMGLEASLGVKKPDPAE